MDLTSDHPFWFIKNGLLQVYPPLTLAMVVREIPGIAFVLDGAEVLIRRLWSWFRTWPFSRQVVTYLVVAAFSISMMVISYRHLWG